MGRTYKPYVLSYSASLLFSQISGFPIPLNQCYSDANNGPIMVHIKTCTEIEREVFDNSNLAE